MLFIFSFGLRIFGVCYCVIYGVFDGPLYNDF